MAVPRWLLLCTTWLAACAATPPPASSASAAGDTTEQPAAAAGSAAGSHAHSLSPARTKPLSAAERERATRLCEALDDPDLDNRMRAQQQLRHDFVRVVTVGTERQMEACAEWCVANVGTAPDWYNPQAKPSFDWTSPRH